MTVFQVALEEYSWIAAWWLFSLLLGTAVLTLARVRVGGGEVRSPNLELSLFFSMTAGIGAQILLLIVLGMSGQLRATPVLLAFGVTAVLAARHCRLHVKGGWLESLWTGLRSREGLFLLPVLLIIAGWLHRPLGPADGHDEISYHLPYARFYVEQGGLAVNEYLRFPLHAHNFNLLYTLALMRDSTSMAHLMHATAGFVTLVGLHGLARHWFGPVAALAAVVLATLAGPLQESFGNAYVDLGLMMFVTAALFALAVWQERRERGWLLLAGAMLGCAAGTKYYGLLFAVPLGMWVLAEGRRPADFLRLAAVTAVFGCFWYLRSWWISGNPVHPFLSGWFGFYIWRPVDLVAQMYELAEHGVAHTPLNFLKLPWLMQFERWTFHGYTYGDGVLLGLFYLGFLNLRGKPRAYSWMLLVGLAYLVFWFLSAQVLRYLLPIVPVMALAGASLLSSLLARLGQRWWPGADFRGHMPTWARLSCVALLVGGMQFYDDMYRVPVTPQAHRAYLEKYDAGYQLFKAAAADPRIGMGPVLQFGLGGSQFHYPGTLFGDWVGHYGYTRFMRMDAAGQWNLVSPPELWTVLHERGIRAVVFSKDKPGMFHPADLDAWAGCFETVLENRFGTVMIPRPASSACESSAAANGGGGVNVR